MREDETFYFNVCRNTMDIPAACEDVFGSKRRVPRAIGYQTADGVCYKMGDVATARWSVLDGHNPFAGVKLRYSGGSRCDGYTQRSTEFRFECDRAMGVGRPIAVFGDCEFVVRWRTALACPTQPTMFFTILFWVMFAALLYFAGRFLYNVQVKKMMLDWEAVPHIGQIRIVGAAIMLVSERTWDFAVEHAPGSVSERLVRLRARLEPWLSPFQMRGSQVQTTNSEHRGV